jgi:hypothetical protein
MDEDLLFACLQQDGDFIQWILQFPLLLDQVTGALVSLCRLDGSLQLTDLLTCRDAAQTIYMIAREGGFEDVATIFSLQYELFSRAVLPFFGEEAE